MFKKSVFITVLVLLAQHLTAQKFATTDSKKPSIPLTQDSLIGTIKEPIIAKKGPLSTSTKESTPVQAKDSLIAKVEEPVKDSSIVKVKESVKDASIAVVDAPIVSKKSVPMIEKLDSIWLKTGDTLRGVVTLDKDRNAFLISYDTIQNRELRASEVTHFFILPKKGVDDRLEVFSIFNEFYFLESNPNAPIKVFANKTFKVVENNGPKYYTTQTKYCLLKNDTPYFMNKGRVKETLLFLVNDCKAVVQGFKTGKYTTTNFIEAITHYNRCNDLK